jgi:Ran GTPase-activating protein (RanGAP) involved in mRNA processing and transport
VLLDSLPNPELIEVLNLSHNAIGQKAVGSLIGFLAKARNLKVLNITNCGMDATATQTLAQALNSNDDMKLTEFIAFRNKLRDGGIEAMANVFEKQESLEVLKINSCDIKLGFVKLFEVLMSSCHETMRVLHIQDNLLKKVTADELGLAILSLENLEELDMSDCNAKKSHCILLAQGLAKAVASGSKL